MIPSTGVTLSFISYGGSSLFSSIFLFQGIQAMRGEESKKKKEEKYTGQQIRMVVVCALILLLLCTTASYFLSVTVKEAKESFYNEYNPRISKMEKSLLKGRITTADGILLARSIKGEDGVVYRLYPRGEETAFVTGQMLIGRTGLEQKYWREQYQVSIPVFEKIRRQAMEETMEGNTLVTTIDNGLQKKAYEALSDYAGAVAAMDIQTGKILAYVSTPSYNPNELSVQWDALLEREDAPMFNRITGGLYPPGSTFKLITTLAYLKQHSAEEFVYTCTGEARFRNTTVHCNNEKAHGKQTLKEAFANSCNTAYAYMGELVSDEDFIQTAEELGFGEVWDGTLSYTASSFEISENTADASRVQASFGQGEVLMTPFHKLMLTAAIANDGVLKLPYLEERLENCMGETVAQYASYGEKRLLSAETAALLKEYMVAASEDKMQEFAGLGITVAGKTGSAESSAGTHSWYICFAPAEEPQIALVVLMEGAGSGSRYAVPAAKKILQEYFEK